MIRINLLPEEERGKRAGRGFPGLRMPSLKIPMVPQTIWIVSVIGVLLVIFLGAYLSRRIAIGRLDRDIARMETRLAKLKREADLVQSLETKTRELQNRLGIINKLNRDRFLRVKMLDDLCSRVPDYIWLTSFEEVSSQIKITGLTFSNLTVAKLIEELSESDCFSGPDLVVLRKKAIAGQDVMEFTVTVGMKEASPPATERQRLRRGRG